MLVVALTPPQPDLAAGERRFAEILDLLRPHVDIDFVALFPAKRDSARYETELRSRGVRFLGYGRRAAQVALVRREYHVIFCEFYHIGSGVLPFARVVQPAALRVIDTVDVHFARESGAVEFGQGSAAEVLRTKETELVAYALADHLLAASNPDRDILRSHGFGDVATVPCIIPVMERRAAEREPNVLFVGAFAHGPNEDGIRWFLQECWHRVRAHVPDATLTIIGRDAPPDIATYNGSDGVVLEGFVPSTEPYLAAAQLSIAPLRYGGGMKGKVAEALAHGVPVVTTSVGAQGFVQLSPEAYIVADSPDDFATAVASVLRDSRLQQQLSRQGQAVAVATASRDAAREGLARIIAHASQSSHTSLQERGMRLLGYAARWVQDRVQKPRPVTSV